MPASLEEQRVLWTNAIRTYKVGTKAHEVSMFLLELVLEKMMMAQCHRLPKAKVARPPKAWPCSVQ